MTEWLSVIEAISEAGTIVILLCIMAGFVWLVILFWNRLEKHVLIPQSKMIQEQTTALIKIQQNSDQTAQMLTKLQTEDVKAFHVDHAHKVELLKAIKKNTEDSIEDHEKIIKKLNESENQISKEFGEIKVILSGIRTKGN